MDNMRGEFEKEKKGLMAMMESQDEKNRKNIE